MTPYGYPPDRYHCLLDEQPYYLTPPRLLRRDSRGPLFVNPQCWFSWRDPPLHGFVPPRLDHSDFIHQDRVIWVLDAATGAAWPYWVGSEYLAFLAQLVPGRPAPAGLPTHISWVLTNADILVPGDHLTRARGEWDHYRAFRAADFRKGFVAVPNFIPPFHLGALRRYYRYKVRTGSFQLGDDQVGHRYAAHGEPVAMYVHEQLALAVSEIVRAAIKRSYAYFVAYQSGSRLERHTDRPQCEYSVTLLIDSTPEPAEQSPWPIKLDTPRGTVAVWQYLGEALLYRGRRLPHHRDRLPAGCTSSSLLLHYVDKGFVGSLE